MASTRGMWLGASALCMTLIGCGSGQAFADGAAGRSAQASGGSGQGSERSSRGGAASEVFSGGGEPDGGQPGGDALGGAPVVVEAGGNPSDITWKMGSPKGGDGSGEGGNASWQAGGRADETDGGSSGDGLDPSGGSGVGGVPELGGATAAGGASGALGAGGRGEGGAGASGRGGAGQGGAGLGGTGLGGTGLGGTGLGGTGLGGTGLGGAAPLGGAPSSAGNGPLAGAGGASRGACGVFVNEVQVGSSAGAADEFVELYNSCRHAVSLAGLRLIYRAAGGNNDVLLFAFAATDELAANSFVVLGGAGYVGTALARWGGGSNGVLSAQAGGIALSGDAVGVVDALGYGNASNAFVEGRPALTPTLGTSTGRLPDGADTNDNWRDFAATTSTPGAPNH